MQILGIETSCDDTGVAIYDDKKGLLINKIHSQSKVHSYYGGVVPELASRHHINKLYSLIQSVLINMDVKKKEINAIAYTAGPGLIGSLLVGATIGSALAYSWKIPTVLVNHMEGHLLSPMLELDSPKFPFVALLVSGGHTQLISAKKLGKYKLLGNTLDDAAGEAFDKIAKLLGLSYPGGSELSKLAKRGQSGRFFFPRPMTKSSGLNFSFSGLKTFTTNFFYKSVKDFQTRADIARAFEDALVDTLVIKCKRALNIENCNTLVVSGGVAANNLLRLKLDKMITGYSGKVFYPRKEFCTDNAAMIAYTGMRYFKLGKQFLHSNLKIKVNPRWSIV